MEENFKKIDAHSHIGGSYLGPKNSVDDYLDHIEDVGVIGSIVSPGPSPEIYFRDSIERPCLWKIEGGTQIYYQETEDRKGKKVLRKVGENPYKEVNRCLIKLATDINKTTPNFRMYVTPLLHPLLDTESEINYLLANDITVGLKVHGISTYSGPADIKEYVIKALIDSKKVLVAHTDNFTGLALNPLHRAYKSNDPLLWVNWAENSKVKVLLTHGLRLSREAVRKANTLDNVIVGLAPDLLLEEEKERLSVLPDGLSYLECLFNILSFSKMVFDIDFGWNVKKRGNWNDNDWAMHERLLQIARRKNLGDDQIQSIFSTTAIKFFRLDT